MELKYLEYLDSYRKELLELSTLKHKELKALTNQLEILEDKYLRFKDYMEKREQGLEVNINDYLDEHFKALNKLSKRISAFDLEITFSDFLGWLYDEFPVIKDKYLTLTNESGDIVDFRYIPLNNIVIVNDKDKTLEIFTEYKNKGNKCTISMSNINLYLLFSTSQEELDKHLLEMSYEEL